MRKFFTFAAQKMKKRLIIYCLLVCTISMLTACHKQLPAAGKQIENTLYKQESRAENLIESIQSHINNNSFDSIWDITQQEDNILFYIYDSNGLVYWSQNWLAGEDKQLSGFNRWYYVAFDNAHTVCRWTSLGRYNMLTVIPIKYNYSIENQQLQNKFLHPFKGDEQISISRDRVADGYPVTDADNHYLFSIFQSQDVSKEKQKATRLSDSFSYQSILNSETAQTKTALSVRIFYIIEVVLFVLLLLLGIVGLIYNGGWHKLRMGTKFLYVTSSLLLFISVYVFVVSIRHVRRRYENEQIKHLAEKTLYLQKNLQDMYFWNIALTPDNMSGMNIDLRDLSYTYQMDIHVYDMAGQLVGTSAPTLYEKGLISSVIAPEPIFSHNHTMTQYEQIGDMRYLAAYTDFVNGNYLQIGYIAVSLYLSMDEVNAEVDDFLAKLLPPNLIVLFLAVIFSFLFSRGLTKPLQVLAEKMRDFRIGERGNRLIYRHQDEVGELVKQYNKMVEELERSSESLANAEREGAWRTMARQIAHEINNPLTPMKLTIQQLQRRKMMHSEGFDDYFDKSTNLLIEQIDTLSRIAQSFSQFAKMPEVKREKTDVATKLYGVIQLFRENQTHLPIRYIGAEQQVYALTDAEQISQVFNNLIKNALQAIENNNDGDIIVMLKEAQDKVIITVSDNGNGIAEDIRDKIFRPNFTTKSTGMGLGLAISKNIVESSGGTISFVTSDKGTTFTVELNKI